MTFFEPEENSNEVDDPIEILPEWIQPRVRHVGVSLPHCALLYNDGDLVHPLIPDGDLVIVAEASGVGINECRATIPLHDLSLRAAESIELWRIAPD